VRQTASAVGRRVRVNAVRRFAAPLVALVAVCGVALGVQARVPQPPEPPPRSLLTSAFAAIDAGAFNRARRLRAVIDDPLVRKALNWFILVEQRQGGRFAAYTAFLDANPDWPWQRTLQYRAEGVMPADLPAEAVRAFFATREPVSAYGAERYADALADEGDKTAARAILRHTWVAHDFRPGDDTRFYKRYRHLLDDELHRQRLDRLTWERRLHAAERQLDRVDGAYRRLGAARIRLARMAPGVDRAIARVPAALRQHPGLVYERARWRQRKGRYEDTVELLLPTPADLPHPDAWWPVRHWAAREALDRGHITRAYRLAAGHRLDSGLGFAQGEWLAGWIALRMLAEPDRALEHFTRLYEGVVTPVSRARGAFWAGEAAAAAQRPEEMRRWYETAATKLTTFYGQLAAARLGGDMFLALPRSPEITAETREAFHARELVRVITRLAALGRADRTDRLVRHLFDQAETREAARLVADLAVSIGRRDLAVEIARDLRRKGMILPRHLYPRVALLTRPGGRMNQERALLLALVRQESSFDTAAVSPAGAYGLMQLMPATARQVAARLDLPYDRERLRRDADYNLRLGHAYIERLIARYDGSLLLAVAAYNAGPARVDRWLERYGDPRHGLVGPVDWIESLPFSETRNYVQRVFESYMIYRHRNAPGQIAVALNQSHLLGDSAAPRADLADGACCL